ncbi:hypothetical protein [Synechococcus sp. 1G10]|uniref:hypothetical protein n=1 Tax=Synechococcus sp. 1G10 TaxID=2025605 RepID=UPI000B97F088|nr:hypothetical protein [Synechococcus sp. 1G10]
MNTPQALQSFADWVASIRGDEASEAQTYVNRLLQAWGWADAVEAAETFRETFQQVKDLVRPQRVENRREVTRVNWWRYGEKRPAMREALKSLSCFFAVP